MEAFFRNLVLVVLAVDLVWLFMPWGFVYSDQSIQALSWQGFEAYVSNNIAFSISWLITITYTILSLGLIYFKVWARKGFLFATILFWLISPIYGIQVSSSYEAMFAHLVSMGDGAILAIAYLTSVSKKFSNAL
jgi:hypothetical protein